MSLRQNNGFTLLEILMVIAIGAIVVTIVFLSFSKLNSSQALDKSAMLVVSVLNEARSLTLSSVEAAQYGVNLQASQLVLFKGSVYLAGAPENVVTILDPMVALRNVNLLGGGSSVVFKRLSGETDQSGTVEVYLKAATTSSRTITVSGTGVVEEN